MGFVAVVVGTVAVVVVVAVGIVAVVVESSCCCCCCWRFDSVVGSLFLSPRILYCLSLCLFLCRCIVVV